MGPVGGRTTWILLGQRSKRRGIDGALSFVCKGLKETWDGHGNWYVARRSTAQRSVVIQAQQTYLNTAQIQTKSYNDLLGRFAFLFRVLVRQKLNLRGQRPCKPLAILEPKHTCLEVPPNALNSLPQPVFPSCRCQSSPY